MVEGGAAKKRVVANPATKRRLGQEEDSVKKKTTIKKTPVKR
jgi:hypothetical protein